MHRYSTNRVTNGDMDGLISVFSLHEATGVPTLLTVVPTGGKVPRDMILTADGTLCLVANQNSDNISSFSVNAETGELTHLHTTAAEILSPVSLLIVA